MTKFNLNNIQSIYHQYQKKINYALIAILIIAGSIYYYFEIYKKEKEEKANEAIYMAQKNFQMDSLSIALNGAGNVKGFLHIIKKFSGTKAANLSHYYAGIIYLKQGQFKKAIEMLEDFSSPSDILEAYSKALLADAYSENKEYEKAINLYKKVGKEFKGANNFGAENLLKAGLLLEMQNKNKEALEVYKKVINDFASTPQKQTAEKYLAHLEE